MKPVKLCLLLFFGLTISKVKAQVIDTLLDIGTYKLHFKVTKGKGVPILFESGGGLDSKQWDSIGYALHSGLNATIITYDRQGMGKSGLDTAQYNLLDEIKGLEIGLKQLGYANSKVVLVCHSLGAFYGRLYAARHPKFVRGIVMLDPRIPSLADMTFARNVMTGMNRKQFKQEELGLYYVLAQMESNSDYLRKVKVPSSISVLDIMAEHGPFTVKADNDRFKSDQRRFVKEAPNRTLVFAKGSSHNIALDRPVLVIKQVTNFYKHLLIHK
ncbi:MAG: alpha/beta hydrolase [Sphingobacteriaceae bacterium]|nr:MAG: alpha/beta hydrolase [Sphingobacteriaceae bacterium]